MVSTSSSSNVSISLTTATPSTTTITSTSKVTTTNSPKTGVNATTTNPHELTDGQKAGIAVGVIGFVIIIVAIIVFIAIRRRRHGRRPLGDGATQDEGNKEHGENKQKRTENKYVRKGPSIADKQEVFYENPAADQSYYNVEEQNSDSADKPGSRKLAVMKQDSVPTIYAPPPPMEDSRTSVPVEIAPTCPVIDEDEYIIPEDPSKITVPKRPPYTGNKPPNNDGELYIAMSSAQGEELYIDPDLGQDQKSYMNFDVNSKPVKDEERKGVPMDYVNLSKEEKGVAFGVHPKQKSATPKWEATTPVTINDEESYQNVLYENRSMQNKKTQRKK